MNESEILPAPVIDFTPRGDDKFERERQAYLQRLPELLRTHRGKYVAIHPGEVVDVGDDLATVAERVYRTHGYQPIYIDLVIERAPVTRIPRFRVVREGESG